MRRSFLCFVALLAASAQVRAQVGFGAEVGYNGSDYKVENAGVTTQTDFKFGGRLGVLSDIPLTDNFYFQPALKYVTNGYIADITGGYNQYVVNTVELPLNIQYKFGDPDNNRAFVGIGPYAAYNMNGYYKLHVGPVDSKSDLRLGSGATDHFKRFDLGAGINAGYQHKVGLFVRARVQMGLLDLSNASNGSIKNMGFCISGGYFFYQMKNDGNKLKVSRKDKKKKEKAAK